MSTKYQKCQCNKDSAHHKANECTKIAIYKVGRGGKILLVCDDCIFSTDTKFVQKEQN